MLHAEEWNALWLSVRVACVSVLLMLIPGIACAWMLARKRFFGRTVLESVLSLPLVLPPVVIGYLLLVLLGREGPVGRWLDAAFGVQLAFTWHAAAMAGAVMGFPLLVRSVRLGMEMTDRGLEDAARTLGAPPWRVFVSVTLPLSVPGIITGVVLAGARSFGEFGATITFAGNIEGMTRTLPLAIFTHAQQPGGDAAAVRLVVISIVVSLMAMIGSEILARRAARRLGGDR